MRSVQLLAYSGEIQERAGVKIALASGDNVLQAFPFDISALYLVTVVSASPTSLTSDRFGGAEGGFSRG
ncbi:uncharacterized [Tachysurus ichikawai]